MLEGLFPHLADQVSEESIFLCPTHPVYFVSRLSYFKYVLINYPYMNKDLAVQHI